jgi:hypothetical protein
MIIETEKKVHWNYFLALESDVENLSRYVEFTEKNYLTYSIEMVRLLLAACSEIDVIAKILCKRVVTGKKPENMDQYREILKEKIPYLPEMKILIQRYGLETIPWKNWQSDENPEWWKGYNEVKHERNKYFEHANLKNTLNSIGGLFIFLLYLYTDDSGKCNLNPIPSLLNIEDAYIDYIHTEGVSYSLPQKQSDTH